MPSSLQALRFKLSLEFFLLIALLTILVMAGGASQAEASGQAITRLAATALMIVSLLFGRHPVIGQHKQLAFIFAASLALVVVQLLPLPPVIWGALPGREPVEQVARLLGEAQPWRPLSLSPGATINAAASLLVPAAVLLLCLPLTIKERWLLLDALMIILVIATVTALMQFSGLPITNSLSQVRPGEVTGIFANRNHLALFLAIGLTLLPAWAYAPYAKTNIRQPIAIGLTLLIVPTIMATGSRAGIGLGMIGLAIGAALAWKAARRSLSRYRRWAPWAAVGAIITAVVAIIVLTFDAGRAISIDRILTSDAGQDLRQRALPTIIDMVGKYFPAGTGFGSFDRIFAMHEKFDFLSETYMNHAHNDFLEILLDGGLLGGIVMLTALLWWLRASIFAWRGEGDHRLAKLGSAIILLVLGASIVDYPARTPIIMALVVIAAIWLGQRTELGDERALPTSRG